MTIIQPRHHAPAPVKVVHVAKPKPVKHVVKPQPYYGNCNPFDCVKACADATFGQTDNPECQKDIDLYDRKQNAADKVAQAKQDAQDKKEIAAAKSSNDCSSEATAIAIVEAMTGHFGNAVAAGKIAGQTAGTGEKC